MSGDAVSRVREKVSGLPGLWLREETGPVFCPGCQHPVAAGLMAQVLEEMGMGGRAVVVVGVGCHCFVQTQFNIDLIAAAHGRPPDVATAIKRTHPGSLVFTIQGDGDCIAIGAGAFLNAVMRAEKITVFMLNNSVYGTTGGQMAPTTLIGQITSTTPEGRNPEVAGYPIHVPELIAPLKGVAYCARGAVTTPANYQRAKRYIRTAFEKQLSRAGFSFVEILSACPPNRRLTPVETVKWIEEEVIPEFPLGEFKNVERAD